MSKAVCVKGFENARHRRQAATSGFGMRSGGAPERRSVVTRLSAAG